MVDAFTMGMTCVAGTAPPVAPRRPSCLPPELSAPRDLRSFSQVRVGTSVESLLARQRSHAGEEARASGRDSDGQGGSGLVKSR